MCTRSLSNELINQEWLGNYVQNSNENPTLDYCKAKCISTPSCQAWKYVTNPGPVCFHSDIVLGRKQDSPNTISGMVICRKNYSMTWIVIFVLILLALAGYFYIVNRK